MILQDLPTLKCSEQTSVPVAIVYSLPSSQQIPWIHYFPVDADIGQFLSLLLAFKNTKTSRHSEKNRLDRPRSKTFQGKHCRNKTPRPYQPHFHATRPGRRQSGPPYLHSVYAYVFPGLHCLCLCSCLCLCLCLCCSVNQALSYLDFIAYCSIHLSQRFIHFVYCQDALTRPLHNNGVRSPGIIQNRSSVSPNRPVVHTNPSRKQSFSKTLFKPEEFENACFTFLFGWKTF